MTDNIIKLNKDDLLRLKIVTSEGIETGEEIVLDLEDIELPLKYQDVLEQTKKNKEKLKNQFTIIDKRQDVKGKKFLTKNQEDKIKAINDFFHRQVEIYNIILGERGCEKLMNGRKLGWTSLQEIDEIVGTQLKPYIDTDMKRITEKVKEKYKMPDSTDSEVLK